MNFRERKPRYKKEIKKIKVSDGQDRTSEIENCSIGLSMNIVSSVFLANLLITYITNLGAIIRTRVTYHSLFHNISRFILT